MANRNDILKCLGTFPKKINLKVALDQLSEEERKLIEYTIEKCDEKIRVQNNDIIEKVQAYVLIPKNIVGKVPGILAIHQHHSNWEIGKSEVVGLTNDEMYSYGLDLVKQGYEITSLQFNE